jgi:uncharacterized damage-inducible protein DinB
MENQERLRELLLEQFEGRNAHLPFSRVVEGLNIDEVSIRPEGLPHSVWELAEHIRRAQYDILDFSRNPDYESITWPDDYWPPNPQPDGQQQWEDTIEAFQQDHKAMAELIRQPKTDLIEPLAHGDGQTLFREAMLIVDHNAYHIGQIVQVRRLLGNWE